MGFGVGPTGFFVDGEVGFPKSRRYLGVGTREHTEEKLFRFGNINHRHLDQDDLRAFFGRLCPPHLPRHAFRPCLVCVQK